MTENPLRIHFFVSYILEQGTYFRFHNLARELIELGHKVTVFAADTTDGTSSRTELRDNVPYQITSASIGQRWFGGPVWHPANAARRFASKYPRCDIAHLFQPVPSAVGGWLRAGATAKFYDWDDLWFGGLMRGRATRWRDLWPRTIVQYLEYKLPRWADRVTTVSEYLGKLADDRGARGATTLYNGYRPNAFRSKQSAREKLELSPNAVYAGFMGRTCQELSWCFEALEAAYSQADDLRIAICGPAPSEISLVPKTIRDRMDYLGQLTPEDTRDFAAAIDLGLLPLEQNAFNESRYPIKFCEHLASGNPLLCSEVGEVGRLAKKYEWAWPAGTNSNEWIAAFCKAVTKLPAAPPSSASIQKFEEQFTWRGIASRLLEEYQRSLANSKRTVLYTR
jgi:glycosyltransferase involved in cell wall biosynthesis